MAKKEKIKVLASNESADRESCSFCKVVEFETIKKKFKIANSTGNCYCKSRIDVMLPTLEWATVAVGFTFNAPYINYMADAEIKKAKMEEIYQKAIDFITKVYC